MSYETRKPNIKLTVHASWFNLLITALTENTKAVSFPDIVDDADALISKLMKYSRPFVDECGADCVDMRFFPNEASQMIWQILVCSASFLDESGDFYCQLKDNYIPKEQTSKTE